MSSTVPPAADTEEAFEADTWDIPELGAEVEAPEKKRRMPPAASPPARVQPPPLPAQPPPLPVPRATPASGASQPAGATPPSSVTSPKPTEPAARAGETAPSSRLGQPPPLPRQRRPSSSAMAAVGAPAVPRLGGEPRVEPRGADEPRPASGASTPGKDWARLDRGSDARRPSGERVAPNPAEPANPAEASPRRTLQQPAGAAPPATRAAPAARGSSASRLSSTERPKGMAVPPPAGLASPEPPVPVARAVPPSRTLLMPSVKVDPGAGPPKRVEDVEEAWDVAPESTQLVAVPPLNPRLAPREASPGRPGAPEAEAKSAPSASAASGPTAKSAEAAKPPPLPPASAVTAAKPAEVTAAKAPEVTAAKAPEVAKVIDTPRAAVARVMEAPTAPPAPAAWVLEVPTTPPAPPALTVPAPNARPAAEPRVPASSKVAEVPTVAEVPRAALAKPLESPAPVEATRAPEAKSPEAPRPPEAPPADAGWLAPIIDPSANLDDIERHEAAVLFDFDSDLLPSASDQRGGAPGQSGESICTFWLGPDCYGLDVQLVNEVLLVDDILPVPWAPPALLGLFNSRGRIVPVVDLAALLGLPSSLEPRGATRASPAILIKADSLIAAAIVDRPGLVVQVDRGALTPTERGSAEPWVKGHLRPEERAHPAVTLLDPESLVQRFLDMSRFPDIRSCLGGGGYRPARTPSTKNSGGEIS